MRNATPANGSAAWRGRLFLGTGWLLYLGPVGPTGPHAHHAFQVLLCPGETECLLADHTSPERALNAAVIAPDQAHAFGAFAQSVRLLYIDPDGMDGRRLRRAIGEPNTIEEWAEGAAPLAKLRNCANPQTWEDAAAFAGAVVDALAGPMVRPEVMHPALLRAMRILRDREPLDVVRLSDLAQASGLSGSRLSHLFSEQAGVPLRPYVLWLRLQRAAEAMGHGATLTEAAFHAGFADGAHLTRVFRRMFGLRPSEVANCVEWVLPPELVK